MSSYLESAVRRTVTDLRRLAARLKSREESSRGENARVSEATRSTALLPWPLPSAGLEWLLADNAEGRLTVAWGKSSESNDGENSLHIVTPIPPKSGWSSAERQKQETLRVYAAQIHRWQKDYPEGWFLASARDDRGRAKSASLTGYGYWMPSEEAGKNASGLTSESGADR